MGTTGICTSKWRKMSPQVTTSLLASSCLHEPGSLHLVPSLLSQGCCEICYNADVKPGTWHSQMHTMGMSHSSVPVYKTTCGPSYSLSITPRFITLSLVSQLHLQSCIPSPAMPPFLMHTQYRFCT